MSIKDEREKKMLEKEKKKAMVRCKVEEMRSKGHSNLEIAKNLGLSEGCIVTAFKK